MFREVQKVAKRRVQMLKMDEQILSASIPHMEALLRSLSLPGGLLRLIVRSTKMTAMAQLIE
jgi:hypothetical protein